MEMTEADVALIRRAAEHALILVQSFGVQRDAQVVEDLKAVLKLTRPRSLLELTPR